MGIDFAKLELPSHIAVKVTLSDLGLFKEWLISHGYRWTIMQLIRPGQLFGIVKSVTWNGIAVEHHIRGYINGTITTEYELPRLKRAWQHLTTQSYSAHERVIELLEEVKIHYSVDETLRSKYNENVTEIFPKRYFEFVEWASQVIFVCPFGYLWYFYYLLKGKYQNRVANNAPH